jgi:hypothetical protein
MNAHRVYHRGQRRAWSAFLQASIRTGYSPQAEERVIARTSANPSKSTRGPQGQVQP